jgi:molecular chaperone IbpA
MEDLTMRNELDFTPFRRSTVGFDRLFDLLESNDGWQGTDNYPPFDLERTGEESYRITLAVAGFGEDEIEITAQQNLLLVTGRKPPQQEGRYIHRGIAARPFERRFGLADFVQVRNAELRDGILSIDLVREIPEEMRPRRIEISKAAAPSRIDGVGNDNVARGEAA